MCPNRHVRACVKCRLCVSVMGTVASTQVTIVTVLLLSKLFLKKTEVIKDRRFLDKQAGTAMIRFHRGTFVMSYHKQKRFIFTLVP